MLNQSPPPAHIVPTAIAAGLGLADRREICGLLAVLEASATMELLKSFATTAQDKLRRTAAPVVDQVVLTTDSLDNSAASTDALRHRLWFELCQALGLPMQLPLSSRKIRSDTMAMGMRAAEVLKPAVIAARQADEDLDTGRLGKFGRRLRRSGPKIWSGQTETVSFPDIVVAELKTMLKSIRQAERDGSLDPEVAAAIRKGQRAISSAAFVGGGWAAFATAVGSAGFAPYVIAAKLSAVIPFVGGPALVSFLAVVTNPVTVVAGIAVLGYGALNGKTAAAREAVAARICVILAVRGLGDQDGGVAALTTSFRSMHRIPASEFTHMRPEQYRELTDRARRIEFRLTTDLPPGVGVAPGVWGLRVAENSHNDAPDAALTAALTAGDMLYHAAAIDPAVLAAADFSRTLVIENPLELAIHISSFATLGAQIGLRGYTAEQLVMVRLVDQGHMVELAAGSTMPGYDLIIDGNPVQVKCGESLSLLQEHFSKYPGIPVIADVDLARMAAATDAPWAHLVTTIDGFDLEYVQGIVARSLDAAETLGDGILPLYALVVGGARAASKAWTGEIHFEDLPSWLVLDLSIRGGLASAGQIGGAFVGLLAIGPAGALILGPVAGAAALLGTGKVHSLMDRAIRTEWHAAVISAAENLRKAIVRSCDRQIDLLIERLLRSRDTGQHLPPELMTWLDRRMVDDVIWAWERVGESQIVTTERHAVGLLIEGATVGTVNVEVMGSRLRLQDLLEEKPSTFTSVSRIGTEIGELVQDRLKKR